MCNEAYLLAESVRDTWLDSNLPCVSAVVITADVSVYIRETTVSEEREITSLSESVTEVWVQNECVSVAIVTRDVHAQNVITILAVCETNLHSNVVLVVQLVTDFWEQNEVVCLTLFYLVLSCSFVVVTNFTADPNLCICCEGHNCYESSKNHFFHNFLVFLSISYSYSVSNVISRFSDFFVEWTMKGNDVALFENGVKID